MLCEWEWLLFVTEGQYASAGPGEGNGEKRNGEGRRHLGM